MTSELELELRIVRSAKLLHRANGNKRLWYRDLERARSLYENPKQAIPVGRVNRKK